jgi:hypothetical protein
MFNLLLNCLLLFPQQRAGLSTSFYYNELMISICLSPKVWLEKIITICVGTSGTGYTVTKKPSQRSSIDSSTDRTEDSDQPSC